MFSIRFRLTTFSSQGRSNCWGHNRVPISLILYRGWTCARGNFFLRFLQFEDQSGVDYSLRLLQFLRGRGTGRHPLWDTFSHAHAIDFWNSSQTLNTELLILSAYTMSLHYEYLIKTIIEVCPWSHFLDDIFVIFKFILGFVDKHRPDRVQFPNTIKCNAIFLRFV